MSGDRLEQLRAKLAGLRGPARVGPLMELTQELVNRHWEVGPGRPEALPLLNEAIRTSAEAYGWFDARDPWRRQVAAQLGTLIGSRHLAHGSPPDDRDRAIALLEDGLSLPQLAPVMQIMARLTLGHLYMITVTQALNGVNLAALNAGSAVPASADTDIDRALACFRRVLDTPAASAEARQVAESMLTLTSAFRTIVVALRGGPSTETIDKIMEAVKVVQRFHEEQSARAGRRFAGGMVALYDADRLAGADPLDRPAMMMDVHTPPPATPQARPRAQRTPPVNDRVAVMRGQLRERVARGRELFTAVEALLAPDAGRLPVDEIDEIVALATAVVDSGRSNRTDHLLLALGLLFRARSAGSPAGRQDVDEAADHLLRAAGSPRPGPAEAVRSMRAVAVALDRLEPGAHVAERLGTRLPQAPGRGV
jgi:hypothetical protein